MAHSIVLPVTSVVASVASSQSRQYTFYPGGPQGHFLAAEPAKRKMKELNRFSNTLTPLLLTLHRLKNNIDSLQHQNTWDEYKKITNPYEFIFLSLSKRMVYSVATKNPLSRSYFKMIEMWNEMNINSLLRESFVSAHAAEGPGGFIEATIDMAKKHKKTLKAALAITLKSTDKNIPGWRKSQAFLQENPSVYISYGADDTGNIYNMENHLTFEQQLLEKAGSKADLYTADGGFDFTTDFNNQEDNFLPLLTAEILLGLRVLRRGGVCIIKLFDTVLKPTIDLLYVTTRQFCAWTIIKPKTSRAANSERYLLCSGFLGTDADILSLLESSFQDKTVSALSSEITSNAEYIEFERQVGIIQEQMALEQMLAIQKTLAIIESKDPNRVLSEIIDNISRSIEWCEKQGIQVADLYKDISKASGIEKLAKEILTSINASGPSLSRRYPLGQFQLRRMPDVEFVSQLQPSQAAESYVGESDNHNRAVEAWRTAEEIRSGNWETVRRPQKGGWKGEP